MNDQAHSESPSPSPSRIAIATDLTELDKLIPHAIAQAKSTHSSVCLIHALPQSDDTRLSRGRTPCSESDRSPACDALEAASHHIEASGIPCTIVVERGVAAEVVTAAVRAEGATSLLIGTHVHGSAGQRILGNVANCLLRSTSIPVFVIGPRVLPDQSHATPSRILHPVSLTGKYRESATVASQLAHTHGAELLLLHIVDLSVLRGSYVPEILTKKNRELQALKAEDHQGTNIQTVVSCGTKVQEILRIATVTDSDWIVMAIEHDYPWWSKTNNAAYRVISQSDRPVVVLRQPPPRATMPLLQNLHHSTAPA